MTLCEGQISIQSDHCLLNTVPIPNVNSDAFIGIWNTTGEIKQGCLPVPYFSLMKEHRPYGAGDLNGKDDD